MFFPEQIVVEILVKLPVRDLGRLRCVSKSWCALIGSPFFINMHLNHSIRTNTNQTVVFYDGHQLFNLCVDEFLDHNSSIKKLSHCPLESGPTSMVLGSCNGLLLVCRGDYTCRLKSYSLKICSRRCWKDFEIWNPNTGEYKSIPAPLPLPNDGLECLAYSPKQLTQTYGFGYDLERDDYIVVVVNHIFESSDNTKTEVDIYSMKLNSWRRMECVSLELSFHFSQMCAVFASGFLHWTMKGKKEILAFDIVAGEFCSVAKPYNLPKVRSNKVHELKGKLYLSSITVDSNYETWIMRDYGVQESWSKLFSIPLSSPYSTSLPLDAPKNRPLAYSRLGNKILLNEREGKLILYDLAGRTMEEDIEIGELGHIFVAYSCVGSLVRLNNFSKNNYDINSQYCSEGKNDANRTKRRRISF